MNALSPNAPAPSGLAGPVLVTAATGLTGTVLARTLLGRGVAVRVLARDPAKVAAAGLAGAEVVSGDIGDAEAVEKAVAGCQTVFHLAAAYREGGLTDEVYHRVHVLGTELVCAAALRHRVARVVHCSTVGIHGHIEEPPATEEYRTSPGDIYQRTKWEGEQVAWKFHREHGLPVAVVRPTAIFGPEDDRLLKLFRLANRNTIFLLGDGRVHYHMVHVDDLVEGFVLAGSVDAAIGEAFIIGGEPCHDLNTIVGEIARILGRRGRIFHLPAKPFQWAGSLCERIFIPLGLNPPIYRRRVDFFTKSRWFSIEKARRLLGYQPRVGLAEGLAATAAAYREAGRIR